MPHHFINLEILKRSAIWLILAIGMGMLYVSNGVAESSRTVYVIPVTGTVDPGMAGFMERVHRETSGDPDGLVVLEIDTFGGMVDSALEIVDTMIKFPPERTIAFVENKAISAGALIALSCGDLVMKPATTIGDCAPISYTQEGVEMLGEKFQSPIRAKFRALAKRNGYPETLAEAMVTPEKEVYAVEIAGERIFMDAQEYEDLTPEEKNAVASKKTVVAEGELLTMDAAEALDLGFSNMTASGIEDMLLQMGIKEYKLTRIEESWSESMVRFIGMISPVLIMIGLGALYMELKAPGFGLPGIIGITCLAIVFLNQYMVGLADYTELLIILAGLLLMGVEVLVLPGFGVAGFAAIFCIAIGLILAFQDFVIPDPSMPWQADILTHNLIVVLGSFTMAFFIGLFLLRFVLPYLSGKREGPYLTSSLKDAHADSSETEKVKPGDRGFALTFLRPSGKAEINQDLFDVVTEGEFIEQGTAVFVSDVKGNRIIVSRTNEK
ncbi:MAG: serine protease [Desulfobacterales bacterium]|jgi:membrane-bound serine protease (ClpP class)|nr:serine protease [Desulfobacterales bacterium]